jgi:RimJ/RimL family protein N-acetyltransferase
VVELILVDNARARRVVERLGFELEGIMRGHVRRGERLLDVALYGLLPEGFNR